MCCKLRKLDEFVLATDRGAVDRLRASTRTVALGVIAVGEARHRAAVGGRAAAPLGAPIPQKDHQGEQQDRTDSAAHDDAEDGTSAQPTATAAGVATIPAVVATIVAVIATVTAALDLAGRVEA